MKKIAIFASGSGTNAQEIIDRFKTNDEVCVDSVFSNKQDAYVLERAQKAGISTLVFNRKEFYESAFVIQELKNRGIDLVVLAGFLWLIPEELVNIFTIINIHPALLPKYGGKGMYGMNVHKAVVENREKESGITIHYVNEKYDEGQVIFQATCELTPEDTPEDVAQKIHQLEYAHYPRVVEEVLLKL